MTPRASTIVHYLVAPDAVACGAPGVDPRGRRHWGSCRTTPVTCPNCRASTSYKANAVARALVAFPCPWLGSGGHGDGCVLCGGTGRTVTCAWCGGWGVTGACCPQCDGRGMEPV